LFIVNNRKDRSPGQRFRFEQYLDYLDQHGFQCDFSPLLNERDDKIFYGPGNYFRKLLILLNSYVKRTKNLLNARKYAVIFVFREAVYTKTTFFERQFAKRSKVVFDFDDSIWLQNVSEANKRFAFLKNAGKTKDIIGYSHLVIAGNEYLANYARRFNRNVVIVPTTIDTKEYQRAELPAKDGRVCIGWSGSTTTIQHFNYAVEALKIIKKKYGDRVVIRVIGDGNYRNEELGIQGLPWNKATEIADLSAIDIGIMPLPDDEWSKGKCGLKGLQYMALEIPTIMSPVGVNETIIKDGENGMLASTTGEWVKKLSVLIEDEALRKRLGKAGRETVVAEYSVEAWKDNYVELLIFDA